MNANDVLALQTFACIRVHSRLKSTRTNISLCRVTDLYNSSSFALGRQIIRRLVRDRSTHR